MTDVREGTTQETEGAQETNTASPGEEPTETKLEEGAVTETPTVDDGATDGGKAEGEKSITVEAAATTEPVAVETEAQPLLDEAKALKPDASDETEVKDVKDDAPVKDVDASVQRDEEQLKDIEVQVEIKDTKAKTKKGKKDKGKKKQQKLEAMSDEGMKEKPKHGNDESTAQIVVKAEKKKAKKGKKVKIVVDQVEKKVPEGVSSDEEQEKVDKKKKAKKKGIKGKRSKTSQKNAEKLTDSISSLQDIPGMSAAQVRKSKSMLKGFSFDKPLQSLMYLRSKSIISVESSSSTTSEVSVKKKKKKEKGKGKPIMEVQEDVFVKETIDSTVESLPSDVKKKKGKGKKGKKKEELPEEVVIEETPRLIPPFVPIIIEPEPEVEEVRVKKEKKKKPKGPKLSDKERRRLEQQRAEEARVQAELEAQRAAEEERIRLEQERRAAIEKEKREIAEQTLRTDQLQNCINAVYGVIEYNKEEDLKEKEEQEWERYLKCDGLPDVSNCAEMNTYLHLWEKELERVMTMDKATVKTDEVIALLDELDDFIDNPVGVTDAKVQDWKWIRSLFRKLQDESLNTAIYRLLRDINKNLNRIDIPTADYRRKEANFGFCLWVLVQLPTPMFNPRAPSRPRIEVNFAELKANVLYPTSIDCKAMAISAIYLKYDHLSDTCPHYDGYPCPDEFKIDLNEYTFLEWDRKLRYKYEKRKKMVPVINPESEELPPPPEPDVDDFPIGGVPIVKYQKLEPSASQYVISIEDELSDQIRFVMLNQVASNVINLRKYLILGGIYKLNLYYQPPQPREMVTYETVLAVLQIPKTLHEVPFHVTYEPPIPTPQGPSDTSIRKTPEEIEAEMKQQEMELDKLMLVTLELPQHVMWFDLPMVGHWNPDSKVWTIDDIHDLRHVEEKGFLTFRTGTFGYFGLASYRYGNLPFQAWEMKPETDGSVTIQLTAAVLMFEFNIKDNLICVTQLQNGPNDALQEIVGIYMKLSKLKRVLLNGGIDIFPAHDSFSYIEGTCEKCWPMERHLYYDIAKLTTYFNFGWSRWNLLAGRRNIVFQMREYKLNKPKQKPHSLCLVTPLKALYIDCTEVSQTFNDEGISGMKFYADLMNLVRGTSSMSLKAKIQNAPQRTIMTVANFLLSTRIMSLA